MFKKLKEKKGNEILQTLIIVAVLGALAITVCVLISSAIKDNATRQTNQVGSDLQNSVDYFSVDLPTT